MAQNLRLIDIAHLNKGTFTFTLPKRVRDALDVDNNPQILSFIEETADIFIGYGGNLVIGTSNFSSSYQVTIPRLAREKLGLKKGDIIGFYLTDDNKILVKKQ